MATHSSILLCIPLSIYSVVNLMVDICSSPSYSSLPRGGGNFLSVYFGNGSNWHLNCLLSFSQIKIN